MLKLPKSLYLYNRQLKDFYYFQQYLIWEIQFCRRLSNFAIRNNREAAGFSLRLHFLIRIFLQASSRVLLLLTFLLFLFKPYLEVFENTFNAMHSMLKNICMDILNFTISFYTYS